MRLFGFPLQSYSQWEIVSSVDLCEKEKPNVPMLGAKECQLFCAVGKKNKTRSV